VLPRYWWNGTKSSIDSSVGETKSEILVIAQQRWQDALGELKNSKSVIQFVSSMYREQQRQLRLHDGKKAKQHRYGTR